MRSVLKTRRARFEALEVRQLLAGGIVGGFAPVPVPYMSVVNKTTPVLTGILPGATSQKLADLTLAADTRNSGRLSEMILLPAFGSDQLAGNLTQISVWADVNGRAKDGPRKDGCESQIAVGYADWQTDVVDLVVYKTLWVTNKGLHVEVIADFNSYLTGTTIGVDTAMVAFCDLRGNFVPDDHIRYKGVDPVLHTMENQTWNISQQSGDKFGSALAGQHDVGLLDYYSWRTEAVAPKTVTFVAAQGDMANVQSFSLWIDTNWDGVMDNCLRAGVTPANGKLVFDLSGVNAPNSAQYEVRGDIAGTLASDPHLQLAFPKDGSGLAATNTDTGKPLRGVRINSVGAGQIQLYTNSASVFTFKANPELVVKELTPVTSYGYVEPGAQDIVLEAFTAYDASAVTITHVAIAAAQGDLSSFTNYVLWWDTNNDNIVDASASGKLVGTQVVFDFSQNLAAGQSTLFEVHADARDDVGYGYLRTQLAGDWGIYAKRPNGDALATDKIFEQFADQTNWYVYVNGGGGYG